MCGLWTTGILAYGKPTLKFNRPKTPTRRRGRLTLSTYDTLQRIRGFTTMRYINRLLTYLLTYLLTALYELR